MNKYNAPEVLNHLLGLLRQQGLDEVADKFKACGLTRAVNQAWQERGQEKEAVARVASRWLSARK